MTVMSNNSDGSPTVEPVSLAEADGADDVAASPYVEPSTGELYPVLGSTTEGLWGRAFLFLGLLVGLTVLGLVITLVVGDDETNVDQTTPTTLPDNETERVSTERAVPTTRPTTSIPRQFTVSTIGTPINGTVPTVTVPPPQVPGAVTYVGAVGSYAQVLVTWRPPGWDGGRRVQGYEVVIRQGETELRRVDVPCNPNCKLFAAIDRLPAGRNLTAEVLPRNEIGTAAADATKRSAAFRVLPISPDTTGKPIPLLVGEDVLVYFSETPLDRSDETVYTITIEPGGTQITSATSPVTYTGLVKGTTYTFTAQASNEIGPGPLSTPSDPFLYITAPKAPRALTVFRSDTDPTLARASLAMPFDIGGTPITTVGATCASTRAPLPGEPIDPLDPAPPTVFGTASTGLVDLSGLQADEEYSCSAILTNVAGTGPVGSSFVIQDLPDSAGDSFARSDSSDGLGVLSDGDLPWQDWAYSCSADGATCVTPLNGSVRMGVLDGNARVGPGPSSDVVPPTSSVGLVDTGRSNGWVTARMRAVDQPGVARVVFRATGPADYWAVETSVACNCIRLLRVESGVATEVGFANGQPAEGDRLRVRVFGSSIEVYVEGFLLFDITSNVGRYATMHGVGFRAPADTGSGRRIDDFTFTKL
jgi:hypothetical protein